MADVGRCLAGDLRLAGQHVAQQGQGGEGGFGALRVDQHEGLVRHVGAVQGGQHGLGVRRAGGADQHDFLRLVEIVGAHTQQAGVAEGLLLHVLAVEEHDALGALQIVGFAGVGIQAQQVAGGDRGAGRNGLIGGRLDAIDQCFVVPAGEEEAAIGVVPEIRQQGCGQLPRQVEIGRLEGRLEGVEQGGGQEGVVVEVGRQLRLAVFAAAQQHPVAQHVLAQKGDGVAHGPHRLIITKRAGGINHAGEHQAVPGGQDFLVAERLDALLAHREQGAPRRLHLLANRRHVLLEQIGELFRRHRQVQDVVAALPVASLRHVVIAAEQAGVVAQPLLHLGLRPHEKLALFPFAIGILGGVEAALGVAHFALHVVQRLARHAGVQRLAGNAVQGGV